jgi:thimet oligopeptidase
MINVFAINSKNFLLVMLGISALIVSFKFFKKKDNDMKRIVHSMQDVVALFPRSVAEIDHRVQSAKESTTEQIQNIIAIPHEDRTFENTARALDLATAFNFAIPSSSISVLSYISTDDNLRDAANKAQVELGEFVVDMISQNVSLYEAFKAYVEGNAKQESLTDEQQYFLSETMKDFKRSGLHLPQNKRDEVKGLLKKLTALSVEFSDNINTDTKSIAVTREQLNGMSDEFINALMRTEDGKYILKTDYPTYFPIMEHCAVAQTRKHLFQEFTNRAYPQNIGVLNKIIALRDQLAKILGFDSYAALNIDGEMAKTPQRARDLILSMIEKTNKKVHREFEIITSDLPASVELVNGKINPWDIAFVEASYKKKHFNLDDREVAQYFPMEKTIKGLLGIYEQFFNLELKEVPVSGLWDDEVKMIEVYNKGNDFLLGYLMLDLYPRKNKYSHACEIDIVAPFIKDGIRIPGAIVVLANFTKSTKTQPSLLKLDEVRTFFHEFGHALHDMLSETAIASFSGTQVKRDFVEMPSQMLEEWLWDRDILKELSCHYQTGESLPDNLLNAIISLKTFSSGMWVLRQSVFSLMSLEYFAPGPQKDTVAIMEDLQHRFNPYMHVYPENHTPASFGHLTGYGARYYGYLWSKVFALDLFDYIKQFGLLNPEIGQKYTQTILAKGGSRDPNELLKDFLGREPNEQAFFKDLGLS